MNIYKHPLPYSVFCALIMSSATHSVAAQVATTPIVTGPGTPVVVMPSPVIISPMYYIANGQQVFLAIDPTRVLVRNIGVAASAATVASASAIASDAATVPAGGTDTTSVLANVGVQVTDVAPLHLKGYSFADLSAGQDVPTVVHTVAASLHHGFIAPVFTDASGATLIVAKME